MSAFEIGQHLVATNSATGQSIHGEYAGIEPDAQYGELVVINATDGTRSTFPPGLPGWSIVVSEEPLTFPPGRICPNCPGVHLTVAPGKMWSCERCGALLPDGWVDEVLLAWPKGQHVTAVHASDAVIAGTCGYAGFNGRDGGFLEITPEGGETQRIGLNGRGWTVS
jgi:hypothetical protein